MANSIGRQKIVVVCNVCSQYTCTFEHMKEWSRTISGRCYYEMLA